MLNLTTFTALALPTHFQMVSKVHHHYKKRSKMFHNINVVTSDTPFWSSCLCHTDHVLKSSDGTPCPEICNSADGTPYTQVLHDRAVMGSFERSIVLNVIEFRSHLDARSKYPVTQLYPVNCIALHTCISISLMEILTCTAPGFECYLWMSMRLTETSNRREAVF